MQSIAEPDWCYNLNNIFGIMAPSGNNNPAGNIIDPAGKAPDPPKGPTFSREALDRDPGQRLNLLPGRDIEIRQGAG